MRPGRDCASCSGRDPWFEQGEQALGANQPTEAIGHYKAAANNKFADDGTKAKSKEQIAVAESMMKQAGSSMKDVYGQAVADFKAGNLDAARTKFTQLQTAGYKAGLFQKSPGDYLKEIGRKMPAGSEMPAVVDTSTTAPVTPPGETVQTPTTPAPPPPPMIKPVPTPAPEIAVAAVPAPAPVPAPVPAVAPEPPPAQAPV